jgi:signal transduction histidine kinase
MSTRPLQNLPTIRLKLGSTIVFAVGLTLALVYVFLGFALQNASRDADYVRLVRVADRTASSSSSAIPPGITVLLYRDGGFVSGSAPVSLPRFSDGTVHIGTTGGYEYAAVPAPAAGKGAVAYAVKRSPGGLFGTVRFLRDFWWQLLVAGAIAAAIALFVARWLARGMTQPLRDMALAARRMETGDYAQRVDTASRDEVGQLAAAFNRMGAELQQVEQLRRDLVANVSHELKTPISALRAHLENLLDGVEQPDPETLQVMLAQSERLGRLVEQLLDLSRIESGDVPLRRQLVALAPLVSEVLSEIGVARADRGVHLSGDISSEVPPVFADRERVHQVLFNLLDNAVRFTPSGGEVRVTAERHNGSVDVHVADTGPGIPSEHLPRLFERFYRVDPARSRDDGGTGIGLAIARSVVEAHGGRIWADSEPGRGSVFTFELPVAPAAEMRRDDL